MDFGLTTMIPRAVDAILYGKDIWSQDAMEKLSTAIEEVKLYNSKSDLDFHSCYLSLLYHNTRRNIFGRF
jgi:hypothetical protein